MNERRDDTSKPETESRPARRKGDYYYDDATGYETYDPEDGEAEMDEEETSEEEIGSERARGFSGGLDGG